VCLKHRQTKVVAVTHSSTDTA